MNVSTGYLWEWSQEQFCGFLGHAWGSLTLRVEWAGSREIFLQKPLPRVPSGHGLGFSVVGVVPLTTGALYFITWQLNFVLVVVLFSLLFFSHKVNSEATFHPPYSLWF